MNEDEQQDKQEDYMNEWMDEWGSTIGLTGILHEQRWMRLNNWMNRKITWMNE